MSFDSLYRYWAKALRSAGWETVLVVTVFLLPMSFVFAVVVFRCTSWELVLDGPMFMYSGFLMDRFGMAPVRDFFTCNMPGTHVVFRWLYRFFGGSVLGMRLADLTVLVVILTLFARIVKPFGRRVVWAGVVSFGILHLTGGLDGPLQPEYLALVPLQLAILSATAWFENRPVVRWTMTGLFVGTLATIKPHLTIGGIVLYGYLVLGPETSGLTWRAWTARAARIACWCALGGSVPVLWTAGYLAYYGQLGAFVRIVTEYLPLHRDIKYVYFVHRAFEKGEELSYLAKQIFDQDTWSSHFQLALAAGAGLALFLATPTVPDGLRRYGAMLALLTLAYFLYPIPDKRFYQYQYYPFSLLVSVWAAFLLYRWDRTTPLRIRACALGVAAYVFFGMIYADYDDLTTRPSTRTGAYHRTVRLTKWLGARLAPGDTVQGIEWASCGIANALLETQAKVATHTIWGEVLWHHVSSPFVTEYRRTFMKQLSAARPRFVIVSRIKFDYAVGHDCSTDFPEFEAFLSDNYFPALDSKDFRIWESNSSPTAAKDRERYEESAKGPPGGAATSAAQTADSSQ